MSGSYFCYSPKGLEMWLSGRVLANPVQGTEWEPQQHHHMSEHAHMHTYTYTKRTKTIIIVELFFKGTNH